MQKKENEREAIRQKEERKNRSRSLIHKEQKETDPYMQKQKKKTIKSAEEEVPEKSEEQ